MQFCGIKTEFGCFHSKMGLYRAEIIEQLMENLPLREAVYFQIDGVMKNNEELRTEIYNLLNEK